LPSDSLVSVEWISGAGSGEHLFHAG